ncbi:MAG: tetratricopeptide repeat protein, partial [Planctomycetales bacterium]|nr:tetratricopeptide repeat protein [Planctomycetales bacterium]
MYARVLAVLTMAGLVIFGAVTVQAAEATATLLEEPAIADAIAQAMQAGNYAEARQQIDQRIEAGDANADYLWYLKGRSLHYEGKYDEAVAAFDQFADKHADSPWARRVRFAKAASLVRMNGYRRAEEIYRGEAEELLSPARKQSIANVYLEFADRYFEKQDEQTPPDYAKALEFYRQAAEIGPADDRKLDVAMRIARCQQRLNQLDAAIALFQSFVAEYKDDPLAIEATFELGQCYFAAQRWVDARVTWQDLLSRWSTSDSERIAEATYDLALTYQLPQPPSTPALDMGVAAARNFIEKYPQHPWLGKAYLLIAQSYKSVQRIDDAQRALDEFLKDQRNAARDEYPESLFLLGQCQQLRNEFDAALATWRRYLQDFPAHRRWHEAQQAIIDTEYQIAAKARQDRQYDLARNQFEAFLTKYPLDHRISEVMYTLGEMQYQQQRWQAAIDDWRNVVMKFADTDVASRAQYRIAVTYEQHLSQFEKALEEYRKVAKGARVHDAQQRIAQLIAKSMAICTERTFRTDEMPQVKLTCRNLESVTVRVYSIDLETYFRKMHLATGVEQLDVSLIDPDMTFEFQVPNYERYREVVGHIPIEGPDAESNGPSVRVVTVSSDSLEATTLVLRSDLEVVCQSSRDEVFVFAENLRTESPFANVRVLVSDGNKVIEEGTTNEQGIYQKSLNELQTSNDVRIFAVADGHTASNVTLLQGLEVSRGLSEKGYLYTDRSVYQAGQPVNIRGIVRSVADDTYRVDEGHVYELTITDPRNRHVWQESVQLNRFGSFHASLVLPGASVQGTYRVGIADDRGRTYEASFLVQQYTLENIQFTVESDRQIYFRGEPITGKILARYYYGAPLADRAVRYRLGEGRIFTGRTNADGEVAFELETQALHESQVVQFAAELPDHNLSVEVPYVVAAQQFSLAVETSRSVFVSGESWEVVVRAVDAEGKPTSRDVTVKVFQRTNVNGQVGERLVKLTKQATTDAGTGEARIALSLADGGEYAVRAEAVDRLGNPVSGSRIVRISGDDDSTRLRILVDRHAYKVGEVLETQIHWREPPALALVTYQGARVLGYQITKLATGTNTLSLPVTEALAPNFELSVCVMTDPKQPGAGQQQRERNDESSDEAQPTRFHTASAPFQVSRALVVTLTPEFPDGGSHAVPGEILPVRIKVSDPQGRPVEGELSLAMIQQATIDRFGAGRSAIARFFQGEPRQNSVRTSSSITFSYHPDSQRINANVLAELDRLAVAASEAAAIDALPELAELANAPTPAAGIPVEDLFDNGQVAASGTLGGVDDQLFANGVPPQHGGYAGEGMSEGQTWEQLGNNLADGERQQRGRFSAGRYGYGMPANQATDRGEPTPTASKLAIDASESQRRGSIRVNFEDIPRLQQQLRQINRQQGDSYAIALADNGIMAHVNLAAVDDRYLQRIAGQVRDNVTLFTGAGTSETGYWNPAIVTDGNGEALVEIPLSGESLAWHVAVLATTTDTLVGEATTKWLARKDLIGQLKLPAALIDGDTAHVEAHVDDFRANKTPLEVTLVTTIGDRRMEQTKSIGEGDDAIRDVTFVVDVQRPDGTDEKSDVTANFELSIKAADRVEVTQRTVAVEPNGLPVFGMSSGTAQGDTTVWVEFPAFLQGVSRPQLQIAIGPSVEQSLLDVLFGPVLRCGMLNEQVAAQSDSTVSDVMAALALQDLLSSGAEEDHPQQAAI